jgi:hypothetical protein
MKESSTYQAILAEEARKILLNLGTRQFGPPDDATRATLEAVSRPNRLERLVERVSEVSSWAELLATPRPQRRNGRRKKPT